MAIETLKNKIEAIEKAKTEKRNEMMELYKNLTENEEILDMLMTQLGKEIERIFPNLKFILLARMKSWKSFSDKLENSLNKCQDVKSIKEIQIYDIIGLNVVIENVPDNLNLDNFKKSECYDKDFESNISNSILRRKTLSGDILMCEQGTKDNRENIERLKKIQKEKCEKLKIQQEKYKYAKSEEAKIIILEGIEELKKDIDNYNEQIKLADKNTSKFDTILEHDKMFYEIQDNECNHEMAKFIIRKLSDFEGIKLLGLKSIKNRFKIIEKDNGYRSIHNCYEFSTKKNSKKVNIIGEIQGKSIEAYYEANKGYAAKYHIQQEPKPGKRLKNKDLPDILAINTPEEKQEFINKVKKYIPRFRIYRYNNNGESEIYKLSLRECYMLYYYNQLFGNELLNIKKNHEQSKATVETDLLQDDAKIYKGFEYIDL